MAKQKSLKTRPPLPLLNLENLETSRNTLAEMIKQYYQKKMKDNRARTLCYLYQTYLAYLRAESEFKILERVQMLEEKVYEHQKNN